MSYDNTPSFIENWLLGFVLLFGVLFVSSVAATAVAWAVDSTVLAVAVFLVTAAISFLLASIVLARR